MTVLAIRDLTLRIAGRALLDGAGLAAAPGRRVGLGGPHGARRGGAGRAVAPGRRVGLVGRNGAGKSTLLRAVSGQIAPDGGEIRLAARARLGHVAQDAPGGPPRRPGTR